MNRHISAEARGVSGYQTPAEIAEAEDAMKVALAQPHRRNISNAPAHAWQATALADASKLALLAISLEATATNLCAQAHDLADMIRQHQQ